MKVLFLDFDGVLGPCYFRPDARIRCFPDSGLHVGCQRQVRRVINATGCKVVVSSAWRSGRTIEEMRAILLRAGVVPFGWTVVGMTPTSVNHSPRGSEISAWLDGRQGVESFAIVDDIEDACMAQDAETGAWFRDHALSPRFVQTMWDHGCTKADADDLIRLLA